MHEKSREKRFLIFSHSQDDGPGSTGEFLHKKNVKFDLHVWGSSQSLPNLEIYSGLIIFGGEQNVDEETIYPWLKQEKQLIQKYLDLNRPILGICLGGQLLAEVLGGSVQRHKHEEVGWKKIQLNPKVSHLIPKSLSELEVFQWHAYRFQTPAVAEKFAENEITPDQGFVYRDNVVGVQFHPEATASWIEKISQEPGFPNGPFVQDASSMNLGTSCIPKMRGWYHELLENLFLLHDA